MPRGPCNLGVLREAWVHGVIDEGTLVWGQGLGDWLPIRNVRTLVPQIRTLEGWRPLSHWHACMHACNGPLHRLAFGDCCHVPVLFYSRADGCLLAYSLLHDITAQTLPSSLSTSGMV